MFDMLLEKEDSNKSKIHLLNSEMKSLMILEKERYHSFDFDLNKITPNKIQLIGSHIYEVIKHINKKIPSIFIINDEDNDIISIKVFFTDKATEMNKKEVIAKLSFLYETYVDATILSKGKING